MKGFDMKKKKKKKKKKTYTVNAARGDRSLNPFNCSSASQAVCGIDRRLPTQKKEVLSKAQGIRMFAEWAPKTELFRRSQKMRDGSTPPI